MPDARYQPAYVLLQPLHLGRLPPSLHEHRASAKLVVLRLDDNRRALLTLLPALRRCSPGLLR
jgi:hypothetical protein